jgi:hypothetical protein
VLLDLREAVVSDILVFDKITSKGRIDLRGSQLAAWHWDSSDLPSQVVGIVDARSLRAGNLTLRSVYFQEIVDFSGMVIGLFAAPLEHFTPVFEIISLDFLDPLTNSIEVTDGRAITQIEYVTFAQDVDFLHTTFYGPVRFNRNRFRATLDFTGSTFATDTAYFCFAFNRINRLIFESKHLGNIRRINAPECLVATTSKSPPEDINRTAEPLPSIYKSLEKAFKDANDRRGVNEAWYLATVAERDQADGKKQTIWEAISAKFSWLLFDIPSRYTVDVWRTVWVSIAIIVCFFILYLLYFQIFDFVMEFWHLVRGEKYQRDVWARTIQIPEPSDRHRAFRFRPFEPIHSIRKFHEREIYPVRDAVSLSIRAFTKLGLGTVYPDSRPLKWLTTIEWALGVFMLIHFILAVKNNLPFILPFLGAVN